VRAAFWVGGAVTLLWAPVTAASSIPPFRAYDGLTDLLFDTFAQWDSVWFVHIADHGYDSQQATAFFPLYPAVVHAVSLATSSTVVAGVLVSLACAGVAATLLAELADPLLGKEGARDSVLLLAFYPVAFVFCAVYSDALFLALALGSFVAAAKQRSLAAAVLGGLAVATRLVGLALLPALLVLLWPKTARAAGRLAPLLLLPAAVGAYGVYLSWRGYPADAFLDAQRQYWGRYAATLGPIGGFLDAASAAWHGGLELLRHLPRADRHPTGFAYADHIAAWDVVQFGILVGAAGLTWVAWRRLGLAYGLYSLATLLLVLSSPERDSPLASLPRFVIADFPLFLALAALVRSRPRARAALLVSFGALGGVAAVAFSRKVWIA